MVWEVALAIELVTTWSNVKLARSLAIVGGGADGEIVGVSFGEEADRDVMVYCIMIFDQFLDEL